jgi:hypothetical protein
MPPNAWFGTIRRIPEASLKLVLPVLSPDGTSRKQQNQNGDANQSIHISPLRWLVNLDHWSLTRNRLGAKNAKELKWIYIFALLRVLCTVTVL